MPFSACTAEPFRPICTRCPHQVHHLCEGINVRVGDISVRSGVGVPGIVALQRGRGVLDHLGNVHARCDALHLAVSAGRGREGCAGRVAVAAMESRKLGSPRLAAKTTI